MRFGGAWIADSEHALLVFEPGRYPVAYFAETDVSQETLERTEHTTQHADLGLTSWSSVKVFLGSLLPICSPFVLDFLESIQHLYFEVWAAAVRYLA